MRCRHRSITSNGNSAAWRRQLANSRAGWGLRQWWRWLLRMWDWRRATGSRDCGGSETMVTHTDAKLVRTWMAAALAVVIFVGAIPSFAHVGNPDVYFQGAAGPYHLIVTVRTPQMIPGVASVEVLSATPGITKISVVPTYIVGPGAKYPPEGDVLIQGKDDPQYFSGKIWLMESGSWQVRLKVEGAHGPGELAVP